MVGNPDLTRIYLIPYLLEVSDLCKDTKVSFSILNDSVNKLMHPFPKMTPEIENYFEETRKYWSMQSFNRILKRIAIRSFILSAANISKIVWANSSIKRSQDLEKIFPSSSYPNLKDKDFRNFIEHFEDRIEHWDKTSQNHNFVRDTMGQNAVVGEATIMENFDPKTFVITYYHKTNGTEKTDLRALNSEVEALHLEIPKIFEKIYDSPPNFYDSTINM